MRHGMNILDFAPQQQLTMMSAAIVLPCTVTCILSFASTAVICLSHMSYCFHARAADWTKFFNRVRIYGSIWCCVAAHPGHIHYDPWCVVCVAMLQKLLGLCEWGWGQPPYQCAIAHFEVTFGLSAFVCWEGLEGLTAVVTLWK